MFRFALRRFYFAVIGMMLLSLPLFALLRVPMPPRDFCGGPTVHCDRLIRAPLPEHRPWSRLIWQTGIPPDDWWPIAVVLLAAEGATTLVLSRRQLRLS